MKKSKFWDDDCTFSVTCTDLLTISVCQLAAVTREGRVTLRLPVPRDLTPGFYPGSLSALSYAFPVQTYSLALPISIVFRLEPHNTLSFISSVL